jgi:hypothetical protein
MKLVIGLLFGTAFEFYDFAGASGKFRQVCCRRYHAQVLLAQAFSKPPCCTHPQSSDALCACVHATPASTASHAGTAVPIKPLAGSSSTNTSGTSQ